MNKYILLFCILMMFGCKQKERQHPVKRKLKLYNYYVSEKQAGTIILKLTEEHKAAQAYKLVDTLMLFNKNNGFLYFQRGNVEGSDLKFDIALKDYDTAQNLNYNSTQCQNMIDVCNEMIKDKAVLLNR